MATPQSGILPEANPHALFLTFDIEAGSQALEKARKMLAECHQVTQALSAEHSDANLSSVIAVGPGIWSSLTGFPQPQQMTDFRARNSGRNKCPATPSDILLHIRSDRHDLNFELANRLTHIAAGALKITDEISGFKYMDSRDLTGFVDGTENPEGDERAEVALVDSEDKNAEGGSYVMLQRYTHNLPHWEKLSQSDQEKVIGRTKDTDEELDDDIRPDSAHISRVVIEEDGDELEILRHSLPWGNSRESGLAFIAYSKRREIFDLMLDNMFDTHNAGTHDHLMDYTRANTGAYFFAPSVERLQSLK